MIDEIGLIIVGGLVLFYLLSVGGAIYDFLLK